MSASHRSAPVAAALAALLTFQVASPAAAQTISGLLVAEDTPRPIPGAYVQLLNERGERLASDISDEGGRFDLAAGGAGGVLRVQIDAFGFLRRVLELAPGPAGQLVDLGRIGLEPSPIEVDEVRVEARETGIRRGREWVRRNQLQGRGTFLAGAMIALDSPPSIATYIADRTDLWVRYDYRGRPLLHNPRGGFSRCVSILVNRWPIERTGFESIDQIPPESIAAIEIYARDRDLPTGYFFDSPIPGCGVIQVWLWNAW